MGRTTKSRGKKRSVKAKRGAGVLHLRIRKAKNDESSTDNIFDSKTNKTDSLFVSSPDDLNNSNNMANQPPKNTRVSWSKKFSLNNRLFSILVGLVFAGVFCTSVYVFAANPWPYTPPAPVDPGCDPTDATCTVETPLTNNFTADFSGSGKFTTTDTITGGTFKVGSSYTLPTADGNSGEVLTTNGLGAISWQTPSALPTQTGNNGKFLTTNGSTASWGSVDLSAYSTTLQNNALYLGISSQAADSAMLGGQLPAYYQTALGFTPVTNARSLTIDGVAQTLSADRTWNSPYGGAITLDYIYNGAFVSSGSGATSGKFYFDGCGTGAKERSARRIVINVNDFYGNNMTNILASFLSGSNGRGYLSFFKKTDPTKFLSLKVDDFGISIIGGIAYIYLVPVAYSADSPFSIGDEILITFSATGNQGATGTTGTTGSAGAGMASPGAGTSGEALAKNSGTDYDTAWTTAPTVDPPAFILQNGEGTDNLCSSNVGSCGNYQDNHNLFLGSGAGYYGTNRNNDNFIGHSAGKNATFYNGGVNNSNFIGTSAGTSAIDADKSVFIGTLAGAVTPLSSSDDIFIGDHAGMYCAGCNNNIFIGNNAGRNKYGSSYDIFMGNNAGNDPALSFFALWPFDSSLSDVSGNSDNGTWHTGEENYTTGHFDNAISTTYGGYVTTTNVRSGTDTTFMAWIYPTSTPGYGMVLSDLVTGEPTGGCELRRQGSSMGFICHEGTMALGGSVPEGQWSFVAGTLSGNTVTVYVNGQAVSSTEQDHHTATSLPIEIGQRAGDGGYPFGGLIDDAAVYTTALSQVDINGIYQSGAPNKTSGSAASNTLIIDSVSSGRSAGLALITGRFDSNYSDYSNVAQQHLIVNGNLTVNGPFHVSGTIDPPSVMFESETKEQIMALAAKTIPANKKQGAMVFFDSDTSRLEIYRPDINVFEDLDGTPTTDQGTKNNGAVEGVTPISPFATQVATALSDLGVTIQEGVASLKGVVADNATVKILKINNFQMTDKATGDIYCRWMDNGDWQNAKGPCSSVAPITTASAVPVTETPTAAENSSTQAQAATQQAAISIAQQAAQAAQQAATQAQAAQQAATQAQEAAQSAQQQVEQAPQAANITSIAAIAAINVANGTALSSANLPTTINVTLSDGTNQTVNVSFDNGTPSYDPNTAGTYVFSGTLSFTGSVTNTNNLIATAEVIVAPAPLVQASPAAATSEAITNVTAGLLNGTWDFIRWLFGSAPKAVSSSPVINHAGASLMNAGGMLQSAFSPTEVSSLTAGLLQPLNKVFKIFK